jgi:hypothetical protein
VSQHADPLPINLDYPEPEARSLEIDMIMSGGRRIRRRRAVTRAAVGIVGLIGIAAGVTTVTSSHGGGVGTTLASRTAAVLKNPETLAHPPIDGRPIVIDDTVRGTTAFTWISTDGAWCNVAVEDDGFSIQNCNGASAGPNAGQDAGHTGPLSLPVFQVLPNRAGYGFGIGLVTADATTVTLTFDGHTQTVKTVLLPSIGTTVVRAYAVWFPLDPHQNGYGWNDISLAVARDASGHVVDQIP